MQHHTKTRLFMWDLCQCDPKRCSGRKLVRQKMVKILSPNASFHGIVLTPDSSASLMTPKDIEIIEKSGVAVIDCSWNEYSAGRGVDKVKKLKYRNGRFLPFLMAGNPVNFGKPYKLNCAEALAGALAICGLMDDAKIVMEVFGWGQTFLDINKKVIKEYQSCETIDDIMKIQSDYTESDESAKERREKERQKNFDEEDDDDSDDDDNSEEEDDDDDDY
ncbi:18S rRNA aminocarboxypropyltransferase [Entamoeba marina]